MEKLYYCKLNDKQINDIKDNPHCIQYYCKSDNISNKKPNKNKYYSYKRKFEFDSKENFDIEKVNDKIHKNKIIEIIDNKSKKSKYQGRRQRPSTNLHHGQLKLFLSTLQFILYYSDKIEDIVYAGSSPGLNIYLFTKMFPKIKWYLVDPRDHYEKLYNNKNVIEIKKELFTNETALYYKNKFKNKKFLFISDIRSVESDKNVILDNELQKQVIKIMEPEFSQLKFKIPYTQKNYKYPKGEIYLQYYPPVSSNETRLVVKKNAKDVNYNLKDYEDKLYYHNRIYRPSIYKHNIKSKVVDNCFDCTGFVNLISLYKKKYKKKESVKDMIEKIDIFFNKKLSNNLLQISKNLKL